MEGEGEVGYAFPLNEGSKMDLQMGRLTAAHRAVAQRIHTCLDQYLCEGQA